jgi:hypothetical protein
MLGKHIFFQFNKKVQQNEGIKYYKFKKSYPLNRA